MDRSWSTNNVSNLNGGNYQFNMINQLQRFIQSVHNILLLFATVAVIVPDQHKHRKKTMHKEKVFLCACSREKSTQESQCAKAQEYKSTIAQKRRGTKAQTQSFPQKRGHREQGFHERTREVALNVTVLCSRQAGNLGEPFGEPQPTVNLLQAFASRGAPRLIKVEICWLPRAIFLVVCDLFAR